MATPARQLMAWAGNLVTCAETIALFVLLSGLAPVIGPGCDCMMYRFESAVSDKPVVGSFSGNLFTTFGHPAASAVFNGVKGVYVGLDIEKRSVVEYIHSF